LGVGGKTFFLRFCFVPGQPRPLGLSPTKGENGSSVLKMARCYLFSFPTYSSRSCRDRLEGSSLSKNFDLIQRVPSPAFRNSFLFATSISSNSITTFSLKSRIRFLGNLPLSPLGPIRMFFRCSMRRRKYSFLFLILCVSLRYYLLPPSLESPRISLRRNGPAIIFLRPPSKLSLSLSPRLRLLLFPAGVPFPFFAGRKRNRSLSRQVGLHSLSLLLKGL